MPKAYMKPKYNLGDKVWKIDTQQAREFTITGVRLGLTYKKEPQIFYGTNSPQEMYGNIYLQDPEEYLFSSKKELIDSL